MAPWTPNTTPKLNLKWSQGNNGRPLRNMHRHGRIACPPPLGRSIFVHVSRTQSKHPISPNGQGGMPPILFIPATVPPSRLLICLTLLVKFGCPGGHFGDHFSHFGCPGPHLDPKRAQGPSNVRFGRFLSPPPSSPYGGHLGALF